MEHYKDFQSERYRFKIIVDELKEAKSTEYQTVLLAFVNCLIISTPQLKVNEIDTTRKYLLRGYLLASPRWRGSERG